MDQAARSSAYPTTPTTTRTTATTTLTMTATTLVSLRCQKAWPMKGSIRPPYNTISHATMDATAMALSAGLADQSR